MGFGLLPFAGLLLPFPVKPGVVAFEITIQVDYTSSLIHAFELLEANCPVRVQRYSPVTPALVSVLDPDECGNRSLFGRLTLLSS